MKLTWNPKWVNPFESPWSIIEKIKYANAISSLDFVRHYGTRNSGGKLITQYQGLLRFNCIDHFLLSQSLGTDLCNHTDLYINEMIGMFPKINRDHLIRKELNYCVDCLAMGYHSLLHQFIFITKCPYHLSLLRNSCKYCGIVPSCDILNFNSKSGFQCACSNYYTEPKFISMTDWQLELTIIDKVISSWVTMDSICFNRIKNTYLYVPSLIKMNEPLQFLLSFGTKFQFQ